jgi:branched-subunit amino acid aminotransferase/4-amino-4-deoxychorismate lyase
MDRLIFFNDRIVDAAQARISPTSAGLLYGWGVFAALRIVEGRAFDFARYWERLCHHAARARVIAPSGFDEVQAALAQLIEANRVREGRARITLLRGNAGGWKREAARESDFLIFTATEKETDERAVSLTVSPYRLLSTGALAGVKRTAMIDYLLAREEARGRGFDDAVIFNERGEIVSTSGANIFFSERDELYTPGLGAGCVAGITRHWVCEIARRLGIHLVEGSFTLQHLRSAREVFLASTARRITPCAGFNMARYDSNRSSMTRVIHLEYQKLLHG